MKEEKWAIGVDLGGTNLKVAHVQANGKVLRIIEEPTALGGGPQEVLHQVIEAVESLCRSEGRPPEGAGVGLAGDIDAATGTVVFGPNLRWREVPFRSDLQASIGMPVLTLNDVRAATWGEWVHGAGRGFDDIVCVFIGTGVGGGVVSGGRVLTGCGNAVGEFGHLVVKMDGPRCTCGSWGCLEALAGGWAVAKRAKEAALSDPETGRTLLEMARGEDITARMVVEAAHEGDPLSSVIVEEAAEALVAGAVGLVNSFSPCRLILGGGMIEGLPELVDRIERDVQARAMEGARRCVKVVPSELRSRAGVVGASTYLLRTLQKE